MSTSVPVYKLQSFPRHEPETLFYMTRLEKLVQEFKGIDKPHSHTFYLVMWISQGSGTHTIDFKDYPIGSQQLYFLTPGQVHSWVLSEDIQGFNLFFEANFFDRVLAAGSTSILFFTLINTSLYFKSLSSLFLATCFHTPSKSTNIIRPIELTFFFPLSIFCWSRPIGSIANSDENPTFISMIEFASTKICWKARF